MLECCSYSPTLIALSVASGPRSLAQVAANKEIIKVVLLLTGTLRNFRKQVKTFKIKLQHFHELWEGDMERQTNEFLAKDPKLDAYEGMIQRYDAVCPAPTPPPPRYGAAYNSRQ